MIPKLHCLILLSIILALSLAAVPVTQTQTFVPAVATAAVRGHISDPTGLTITGAKITITTSAGAAVTTTTADAAGLYAVVGLTPGDYIVQAESEGFAPFQSATIVLIAGEVKRVDIAMAIEAASASQAPPAAKALIFVVWPKHSNQEYAYALFFVNDELVAAMKNGNYAKIQARAGKVVITASEQVALNRKQDMNPDGEERVKTNLLRERGVFHGEGGQTAPQPALRWPECDENTGKKGPICTWDTAAHLPEKVEHGCAKLNWQRLGDARSEDLALCEDELSKGSTALGYWMDPGAKSRNFTEGLFTAMLLPGGLGANLGGAEMGQAMAMPTKELIPWLQMCGPNALPDPSSQEAKEMREEVKKELKRGDSSNNWSRCSKELKDASDRFAIKDSVRTEIEAEAGKAYYFEYSVHIMKVGKLALAQDFKMKPVDAEAGSNEMKGLQLATDR